MFYDIFTKFPGKNAWIFIYLKKKGIFTGTISVCVCNVVRLDLIKGESLPLAEVCTLAVLVYFLDS